MNLKPVDTFDDISGKDFREHYYNPGVPIVIRNLSKNWEATTKWNWDYFKELLGDKKVGIYNNIKSDAYTPVNKADDYTTFGKYIDMIRSGPAEWRIFLFNIFNHAPELKNDFEWPDYLLNGLLKKYPMLFVGGKGSITHMHFDMDLSHILHTHFGGRKRVLLFPFEEQYHLYRKPFEVLCLPDFSNYYLEDKSRIDMKKFPALSLAKGFDFILEHGDTLFMPAGYWHHMEYLDSGFAMSLRAMQDNWSGRLKGIWNLIAIRNIDSFLKKTAADPWYKWKEKRVFHNALNAS